MDIYLVNHSWRETKREGLIIIKLARQKKKGVSMIKISTLLLLARGNYFLLDNIFLIFILCFLILNPMFECRDSSMT